MQKEQEQNIGRFLGIYSKVFSINSSNGTDGKDVHKGKNFLTTL